MSDTKNFILFIVLSMAVLLLYQQFIYSPPPEPAGDARQQAAEEPAGNDGKLEALEAPGGESETMLPEAAPAGADTDAAQPGPGQSAAAPGDDPSLRRDIDTPRLHGSLDLRGARIDDLILKDYRVTPKKDSDNIVLLKKRGMPSAYYAEFGWRPASGSAIAVPDGDTVWTADDATLTPGDPLRLSWENDAGVRFIRTISVDENFMFTVNQRVENTTGAPLELAPYALINRSTTPETRGFFILHEGPIGVLQEALKEIDYDDLREDGPVRLESEGGWLGITDKYWLTAVIPDQDRPVNTRFAHYTSRGVDRYQTDFIAGNRIVPAGGSIETTTRFFAGAKEVDLIDRYEETLGIEKFGLAIDWGWLAFLTRPIFLALDWLYGLMGNFGVAILLLTVGIKLVFFPLANKSYVAMSKMKKLQPKIKALQKQYKDDKVRLQQEMMGLYKKEKVNPASGCLPILIQIPVFFALYKVLFVTIEMRHAPFFGWVNDLSAPDPLLVTTLFGLIPWTPPEFLAIGIWPLLMGVSMYLQQKLNPTPPDPIQQKIFMFMPVIFTFILARFPVGLVIYWTWNNLLSITQQWIIMKRQGVT